MQENAEEKGDLRVDGKWGTDIHTACKDAETDEEVSEVRRMIANDPSLVHGQSRVSALPEWGIDGVSRSDGSL